METSNEIPDGESNPDLETAQRRVQAEAFLRRRWQENSMGFMAVCSQRRGGKFEVKGHTTPDEIQDLARQAVDIMSDADVWVTVGLYEELPRCDGGPG